MNAPQIEPTADYLTIEMERLTPSKTNPRKRFDEAKLAELSASIKQQGMLQPLLVRELSPDTFEIIAGERRYRAAKLAGLLGVPCFVRNLTDAQVLHAQVIENLQRDDLHPMEEAEGYDRLMKEHGSTAESLATEIGRSKGYIYGRLKLCALVPEAREAFYAGDLDASTALLIARIPVGKLQIQALKAITKRATFNTSNVATDEIYMSYRTARNYIQDEFMLDLGRAPFDIQDANLLPKAGACTDCQKRTGNQPELFDDVSSKDVCTDTVCHAMKKTAHILVLQKSAEASGDKIILGKEAKKILPNDYSQNYHLAKVGLASLDANIPDAAEDCTWGQALKKNKLLVPDKETGKAAVQKTLVENPHDHSIITTINIEDAVKALREAGFEITPKHAAKNKDNETLKKQREKDKAEVEQAQAYRQRLFDALHSKIEADLHQPTPQIAVGLYRILAHYMFEYLTDVSDVDFLLKIYTPDAIGEEHVLLDQFRAKIDTLTTQQHFQVIMDILMSDELNASDWNRKKQPETMLKIAKEIGIDSAAIEKEAKAEVKAAAAAAKKQSAKKTSSPQPAAQAKLLATPEPGDAPAPAGKKKKMR